MYMKETPPHPTTAHPLDDLKYLPVSCEHGEEEPVRWDLSLVTSLPLILFQKTTLKLLVFLSR